MNNLLTILAGVLLTVVASLMGLVLVPDWQMRLFEPVEITEGDPTSAYPQPLDDLAAEGKQVYQSLGCIYCHSQQVRPENFGADIDRGWGLRRSVPRDYILQNPPLLGTMRTGPDLANIGYRQPNDEWHYLHLYDPQITSAGSNMQPNRFLFKLVDAKPEGTDPGGPDSEVLAFALPDTYKEASGWIVPTDRAKALVAYIKSLEQKHELEVVK